MASANVSRLGSLSSRCVFGHDDVSVDAELVTAADTFEGCFEGALGTRTEEEGLATITGEGEEVGLAGMVVPLE